MARRRTTAEPRSRPGDAGRGRRFRRRWPRPWRRPGARRPGFLGWLTTTDHKEIGLRFIKTAFVFFLLGGVLALLMRLQLARAEEHADRAGPLQPVLHDARHDDDVPLRRAGDGGDGPLPRAADGRARNVAFPRLMNFGYYMYLMGGLLLYGGLLLNVGPDMGWFSYVPLAGPDYGPGKRVDVWSQMVTMVEISTLVGAVEIIVTVFKMRAPGMALSRMPLFVWAHGHDVVHDDLRHAVGHAVQHHAGDGPA